MSAAADLSSLLATSERIVVFTGARSIALYGDGQLGAALTRVLSDIDAARRSVEGLSQWVGRFDWSEVAPRDDDALDQLVGTFARG